MSKSTSFSEYVITAGLLHQNYFTVVDVGVSGGIDPLWNIFGQYLNSIGFDPLVNECQRLEKVKSPGQSKFVATFVGAEDSFDFPKETTMHLGAGDRLSFNLANELLNVDVNERYNSFQEVILSDETTTLDEYFKDSQVKIDFLKIDTDGHDIEVLYGASNLLMDNNCLGVCVESQFHGATHKRANTFANIDIFLRERGFILYDMKYHRYSRSALPGKFLISIPAQTDIGQIQWADAYYFRDFGANAYVDSKKNNFTVTDIIKLACLFELHELHDCAVELLTVHRNVLSEIIDVDNAVELLVPPLDGHHATLIDYQERFRQDVEEMRFLQELALNGSNLYQNKKLKKCRKIILFGAGGRLIGGLGEIKECLQDDVELIVMDNDAQKWGHQIESLPIISPSKIVEIGPDAIIIVSTFALEILKQLTKYKIQNKLDFMIATF